MKVAVGAVAVHFLWSMLTFKIERRPDTDTDRDEVSDKVAVAESRLEDPKVRAEMERRYCSSSCHGFFFMLVVPCRFRCALHHFEQSTHSLSGDTQSRGGAQVSCCPFRLLQLPYSFICTSA